MRISIKNARQLWKTARSQDVLVFTCENKGYTALIRRFIPHERKNIGPGVGIELNVRPDMEVLVSGHGIERWVFNESLIEKELNMFLIRLDDDDKKNLTSGSK